MTQLSRTPSLLNHASEWITLSGQQITRLTELPLAYNLQRSAQLLQQLMVLFPDNPRVQEMVDNWQKSVRSRALPEEAMTGWNEGMTRLQQLAERLNRLDEQRGKYMTVSELKTEVFGIMQAFNRHIPPEERLRRYGEVRDQNGSEQQQKQMENALAELMSRYWILERGFLNGEYKLISESGNN
ncbi:VasL domain-containing protein [Escherichia coli]|uniref:VasL domain-containing protein n=3 Tax=Escherichia coli TaxID=562 RepID=UPI003905A0FC